MEFVDLPPAGSRNSHLKYRGVVEECMKNPNKFTVIRSYEKGEGSVPAPYVYAKHVNAGSIKALRGLRAYARKEGDVVNVYIGYVPEEQT